MRDGWKPGPPDPQESMVWEVRFPAGATSACLTLDELPPALAVRVAPGLWELRLDPGGLDEAFPMTDDNPKWAGLEVRPISDAREGGET